MNPSSVSMHTRCSEAAGATSWTISATAVPCSSEVGLPQREKSVVTALPSSPAGPRRDA